MATYVFSDVHGHAKALERLLERVAPTQDDTLFMLGDMIDRGPDSARVLRICKDSPNIVTLMGNHEDLMLTALSNPQDETAAVNWNINGGIATQESLMTLGEEERSELVSWVADLALSAYTVVGEVPYIFVHAGLDLAAANAVVEKLKAEATEETPFSWDSTTLEAILSAQEVETLLWTREEFWANKDALIDDSGQGPIIICGHTPTMYLERIGDGLERSALNDEGRCQIVRCGKSESEHFIAGKIDIDCGAAAGAGAGQIGMLRLDDMQEFYEPIQEGE